MAHAIFDLLHKHNAKIFASLIPCGAKPPKDYQYPHFLRKDHIFLQERFFYFLEMEQQHGLFVMDQTEKANDRRFVRKLQDYYLKTAAGRHRTRWIVPAPLFVDSEMSPGVQAADLCLYCINWGFRLPEWSFTGPQRDDIAIGFAPRCHALQFSGTDIATARPSKPTEFFTFPIRTLPATNKKGGKAPNNHPSRLSPSGPSSGRTSSIKMAPALPFVNMNRLAQHPSPLNSDATATPP